MKEAFQQEQLCALASSSASALLSLFTKTTVMYLTSDISSRYSLLIYFLIDSDKYWGCVR